MLSQKARYALRALLAMAEAGGEQTMLVGEIAERHRIPKKFLDQILLDLKHHGLVQSRRGRNGGYALLKHAAAISFGEVVRIISGPIAPLPCLSRMGSRACEDCGAEANCVLRPVFPDRNRVG